MESHFTKFNYPLYNIKGMATTMPAVLKLMAGDEFLHVVYTDILVKVWTIVSPNFFIYVIFHRFIGLQSSSCS